MTENEDPHLRESLVSEFRLNLRRHYAGEDVDAKLDAIWEELVSITPNEQMLRIRNKMLDEFKRERTITYGP